MAAAFDHRAADLERSIVYWVIGLLLSLGVTAWLGKHRFDVVSSLLAAADPRWGEIWLNIALSIASVAAPVWFAWLATKQIGQRFRLAEDYAFKASVAKAYEGYKAEAARLDEQFESRLFDSALTRLEEAPLRLIESQTHGSPWHEIIESEAFKKGLGLAPEMLEKISTAFKESAQNLRNSRGKRKDDVEQSVEAAS